MTELQRGTIALIQSAITGQACPLPETLSVQEVIALSKKHEAEALIAEGAYVCGWTADDDPQVNALFRKYRKYVFHSINQFAALQALETAFEQNGIDYLPLKGASMAHLYRKRELRSMGDADILIRTEQYPRIREIMLSLEYEEGVESNHEYQWRSPAIFVELHKSVIPTYNKDFSAYYGDGWRLAEKAGEGTRYTLSDEDEFLYLFVHFAKHYRDSGIGLRHMTDLWVYRRAKPQMDEAYLCAELEKLHLLPFYRNVCRTLAVWFGGESADEVTEKITDVVFLSGLYGKPEFKAASVGMRELRRDGTYHDKNRFFAIWRNAFPPFAQMKERYPVLERFPILLLFCYLCRIVTAILHRGGTVRRVWKHARGTDEAQISAYRKALDDVGLDYYFE